MNNKDAKFHQHKKEIFKIACISYDNVIKSLKIQIAINDRGASSK